MTGSFSPKMVSTSGFIKNPNTIGSSIDDYMDRRVADQKHKEALARQGVLDKRYEDNLAHARGREAKADALAVEALKYKKIQDSNADAKDSAKMQLLHEYRTKMLEKGQSSEKLANLKLKKYEDEQSIKGIFSNVTGETSVPGKVTGRVMKDGSVLDQISGSEQERIGKDLALKLQSVQDKVVSPFKGRIQVPLGKDGKPMTELQQKQYILNEQRKAYIAGGGTETGTVLGDLNEYAKKAKSIVTAVPSIIGSIPSFIRDLDKPKEQKDLESSLEIKEDIGFNKFKKEYKAKEDEYKRLQSIEDARAAASRKKILESSDLYKDVRQPSTVKLDTNQELADKVRANLKITHPNLDSRSVNLVIQREVDAQEARRLFSSKFKSEISKEKFKSNLKISEYERRKMADLSYEKAKKEYGLSKSTTADEYAAAQTAITNAYKLLDSSPSSAPELFKNIESYLNTGKVPKYLSN